MIRRHFRTRWYHFLTSVKRAFALAGVDISRLDKDPHVGVLGLHKVPIRTIIDIGANSGQFARYARTIFPNAEILSFEPQPNPFLELKRWAANQTNARATAFNIALGDTIGRTTFYCHSDHNTSSSLLRTTALAETVYPQTIRQDIVTIEVSTLDGFVATRAIELTPEVLIKLDVQGYEDRVIRGGKTTFTQARACLLEINLDGLYEHQATFKDIVLLLDEYGYRYAGNMDQIPGKHGHIVYLDALFVRT